MIINSLNTQCRVIFALIMREVHTLYGKTQLGYLWAIIKTAMGVAVMSFVRTLCNMPKPHGMSVLSFLVIGYAMWGIMTNCIIKCMTAIESNKTLLTFPQVSPVDVMVARCIVIFITEVVSAIILLCIGYFLGYEFYINNIGGLLYILFIAFFIGLGLGMIFSSFNSYFPTLERILPIFFRLLMFASGVMFSVTMFTGRIGSWILWNPFLQVIEFTRTCITYSYPSEFVSHTFLITFSIYSIAFGLLLEKFTRKRLLA